MVPVSVSERRSDARGYRLLALALILTALVYAATVRFQFVYDDNPQIVSNPTLTTWKTLPTLFVSHNWKFLLPDWPGNYYRPLFMTWLLVNRMLFGLNPAYWHATTVLLHLLATAMAFFVARQWLHNGVGAGFVALLFGLHPIHVESVAWVSGVTDPLMAVFAFAAFWAWVKGERAEIGKIFWKALAIVFYAAACLSKESAVFLPVVVVVYDVLFGREERSWKGLIQSTLRSWPLWLTALAYLIVRRLVLKGFAHSLEAPIIENLLTIPTIMWGYMRRLAWPVNLSVFYDTPPVTNVLQWRFWLPTLAWILALLIGWRIAKRSRVVALSLLWIFIFLTPAIMGLPVFPIGEWVHDRYLYLPSFGFCVLLVHAISQLPSERELFRLPAAPAAVVLVLVAAMAYTTGVETTYWTNGLVLFARGSKIAPHSAIAKSQLGNELYRRGDGKGAEEEYEKAIQLEPRNWKINMAYGLLLFYTGQFDRADRQMDRAISILNTDPNEYFYQGLSRFKIGKFVEAEESFRNAIRTGANRVRYHFWLGVALERQGRLDEAKTEYEEELRQHPETDTPVRQHLEALQKLRAQ
ncbi:MAG TPA: tetratricopeptide repeat protein [Terriglobales bacterium]|nr:tetratricopeptide repeat protein [Terriglobales bacterium]